MQALSNTIDTTSIRAQFPILSRTVHGKPLVYLDNAASSHIPQRVIDTIVHYHSHVHSNVHRGVHTLSQEATELYEGTREKVRAFINAPSLEEIIFTSGTTDAINLVARSYRQAFIGQGDEIIISEMEHHANIVSWQMIAKERGAVIKVIPVTDQGELDMDAFYALLSERTKMVAVVHISNVLGTVNPVKEIIRAAHDRAIPVLLDGAQSAPHTHVDVQDLDCDFFVFSSHKMYAPTGIGVLYGKKHYLNQMEPVKGGGDMIKTVTFEGSTWNDLPYKFEAGTPSIAAGVALGAAIDFILELGVETIEAYEQELLRYATEQLHQIKGLRIIGTAQEKASIISFVMEGMHPHDIGTILDTEGVAIRSGHHCAQPLMRRFSIPASSRASFSVFNTKEDIDALVKAIHRAKEILNP